MDNIFITGNPGVGKTTLVKKLLTGLVGWNVSGFYTEEIRDSGVRKGFELVDLAGRRSLLSHIQIKGPYRVGKYGVDIVGFDTFLDTVDFLNPRTDLVVIDEIGKMECYSKKFASLVRELIHSDKKIVATISRKGGGLIAEVKAGKNIQMFELTLENRDRLALEISRAINA